MSIFTPGLVHTPVTLFTQNNRIDFDRFAKLIEFHLRSGAESLAVPMHAGESVSLTDEEQQALLRQERYFEARKPQEEISALRQVFKKEGVAGLKGAMRAMGRDCGEPRRPLLALDASAYEKIVAAFSAMPYLKDEPRGW